MAAGSFCRQTEAVLAFGVSRNGEFRTEDLQLGLEFAQTVTFQMCIMNKNVMNT